MKLAHVDDSYKIDGKQVLGCVLYSTFSSKEEHESVFTEYLKLVDPDNFSIIAKLLEVNITYSISGNFQAWLGVELPEGIKDVPIGTTIFSQNSK